MVKGLTVTILWICLITNSSSGFLAQEKKDSIIPKAHRPYRLTVLKESLIFGLGIVNGVVSSSFSDTLSPLTKTELAALDRRNINGFDRPVSYNYNIDISHASDYIITALLASPFVLPAFKGMKKHTLTVATMYLELLLWSAFVPSYTKGTVGRIRPYAYSGRAPEDLVLNAETRRSFFSGHSCMSFATAVFFSSVYANYFPRSKYSKWVWAGTLTVASIVAAFRVFAGAHFITDVLVGASVGTILGATIPWLHKQKKGDKVAISLSPFGAGVCLKL
jgi:membrane-associated phospholipid phosphatase